MPCFFNSSPYVLDINDKRVYLPEHDGSLKILIIDLDNCAFIAHKEEASMHFLSQNLLEFAKQGKYFAFGVCSHRCYKKEEDNVRNKLALLEPYQKAQILENRTPFSFDAKDLFTTRMVENFMKATDLPCLFVSTPDDQNTACSQGFKKALRPYDQDLLPTQFIENRTKVIELEEKKKVSLPGPWIEFQYEAAKKAKYKKNSVESFDSNSKNEQLAKIIAYLHAKIPKRRILADFVDDVTEIVKNALVLPLSLSPAQRARIQFNVFQHDAWHKTQVLFCGQARFVDKPAEGCQAFIKKCCCLPFFKKTAKPSAPLEMPSLGTSESAPLTQLELK